jgi:peptidyl-prolyl cis-trans isomerase C
MKARLLRAPLLHFLLIGGVLLGLRAWWAPQERAGVGGRPRIILAAADLARLREVWVEAHDTPPGPAEEQTMVRDAIDEEILYREGLARGFDRQDDAVRERLVRLAGFVSEDAVGGRDALERAARQLGLQRSDLVIRRHLVEMMRLALGWLGPDDLPSEADLEAWLARHAEQFRMPPRVRLTHVYLSEDARGTAVASDAAVLLGELRRTGAGPEAAAGRGDVFIRGTEIDASVAELARAFGAGFAAAVEGAPVGAWVGPVRSSYGLHLVWVQDRVAAGMPPLASVRTRVLHGWLRERSDERAREAMEALRARYDVVVGQD